jgi:hypothetical protein
VWLAQIQAERFGAFQQAGNVRVAANEVVDEFSAQGHLSPDHLSLCCLVAPDQCCDRVIDDAQHSFRCMHRLAALGTRECRQFPPKTPRRGQIEVDHPARWDALLRGSSAECANSAEVARVRPSACHGRGGEHREVFAEQVRRDAGVLRGSLRDGSEPGLVGGDVIGAVLGNRRHHRGGALDRQFGDHWTFSLRRTAVSFSPAHWPGGRRRVRHGLATPPRWPNHRMNRR